MDIKPKRVNFIAIQWGHGIACNGYKQPNIRTGYEQIIGERNTDLYCYTAKFNGRVISKNEHGIVIEYEDKVRKGVTLGRKYGSAAGIIIPHEIKSDLVTGQTFVKGDTIAYNTGWFEKDYLLPNRAVLKTGVNAKVVLWEANETHEDSSVISTKLAAKLTTKTTKVKTVVVNFDQEIRNLVAEGSNVNPETVLCMIEDQVTSNAGFFDEESINTLRLLSAQTPTAKVKGVVERVEVFYHGDIEDMSQSLQEIVSVSDAKLSRRSRSIGKPAFTGSVTDDFRVDGEPLRFNTLAIKIYMTSDVVAGVGD